MSTSLAAIVGGLIGAIASLVIVVWFLWFCILHCKFPSNRNSETGSSDPPTIVEWSRRGRISFAGGGHATEHQGARQFTLEELSQATKSFDESNLVGSGSFGLAYKGLLLDGTIVAIKMRRGAPQPEFVEEVKKLSEIHHRNLVTLIGYCQEGGLQMLVFEYLPNGSISHHLYDTGRDTVIRLEFKQRLSVAIGTAKGLNHLHSLVPQVVHKDFKSSNVLVDENFIAKVADAGIAKLLQRLDNDGSSRSSCGNVFQDPDARNIVLTGDCKTMCYLPRVEEFGALSEASDVYSFGVFLLELITGQEAAHLFSPESEESLAQWVETRLVSNDLIDRRLGNSFTSEGMKDLIGLTLRCLNPSARGRPKMSAAVAELDRILEMEMMLTTVMGDGTAIVTLGSQLFTSS